MYMPVQTPGPGSVVSPPVSRRPDDSSERSNIHPAAMPAGPAPAENPTQGNIKYPHAPASSEAEGTNFLHLPILPQQVKGRFSLGGYTLTRTSGTLLLASDGSEIQPGKTFFLPLGTTSSPGVLTTNAAGSYAIVVAGTTAALPISTTGAIMIAKQTFLQYHGDYIIGPDGRPYGVDSTVKGETGEGGNRIVVFLTTNAVGATVLLAEGMREATLPSPTGFNIANAIIEGIGGVAVGVSTVGRVPHGDLTGISRTGRAHVSSPFPFTGGSSRSTRLAVSMKAILTVVGVVVVASFQLF
ncbi:hypothetical protein BDZ85DRAFT_35609 [Elsinoe ampelina]|uniref:Uncharacterized protein n=1 Tax=Elsinoe ampelina TaxID=302913 RepID=A0A6A6G282_9PEZI|nr:hypothetical protein BDZ85DRAFT_35609 [Elsinoe ampelina]